MPTRVCNAVQALLCASSLADLAALPVMDSAPGGAAAAAAAAATTAAREAGGRCADEEADGAVATGEQALQGHVLVALGKLAVHDAALAAKVPARSLCAR